MNEELDDLTIRLQLYIYDENLINYKNDYDIALDEYEKLISQSNTDKNEVKNKAKEVSNKFEIYNTYKENIERQTLLISEEITGKTNEIKTLENRNKVIEERIKSLTKRNDVEIDDTIAFMYHTQQVLASNQGGDKTFISCDDTGSSDTTTAFYPRDYVYDDSGNEEEEGIDSPIGGLTLSYETMFKHYLLIDYLSDKYKKTYEEYFYLIFQEIVNSSLLYGFENDVYTIFENSIECGSECTDEQKSEAVQAKLRIDSDLENIIIPNVENDIKMIEEEERRKEKENNSQKISEKNTDDENKDEENELEKIIAWGMYDIGQEDNRYENEAEFFENLEMTHPFFFKSLKEKFKYFNPAFHSLSPEGFNARLTFLQQCTRQGATIEATSQRANNDTRSSVNGGPAITAANLAFGRMPVCVLRIGDFIHTRCIIENMRIEYGNDGIQWDLNPEGSGVQPMFAKVSMTIILLGGQSMETPINRLQNANSFNYYANAEVYDNRADSAIYNRESKDIEYTHVFDPVRTVVDGNKVIQSAASQRQIRIIDEGHKKFVNDNSGEKMDSVSGVHNDDSLGGNTTSSGTTSNS